LLSGTGKELALALLGHVRMAAKSYKVLEGWLLFQLKGREMERGAAESLTAGTSYVKRTVCAWQHQSFYGRLARREGRFDKAIWG